MFTQRRLLSSLVRRVPLVEACGLCLLATAIADIGQAESPRIALMPSGDARVRSVLLDEADGRVTDRAWALAAVRAASPNLAEACWHSGWIHWRAELDAVRSDCRRRYLSRLDGCLSRGAGEATARSGWRPRTR